MERMEKRIMANVCRQCVATIALSLFIGLTSQAQIFTNGGFELGSGLYTNTDNTSQITTAAVGWVQINDAIRISISDACSSEIARSGTYALQCYGPSVDNPDTSVGASFARQFITNGVSPGQVWELDGWALTPSCDPMSDSPIGFSSFGCLQIQFWDSTGTNQIGGGITSEPLYAPDDPNGNTGTINVDTWYPSTVTAVVPPRASQISFLAMHVGDSTDSGSIYWDDLSVTNYGVPFVPPGVTNYFHETIQSGNQICWPTVAFASYQAQFSEDNVNWTNIGSLLPGDGNSNCVFGTQHKYYRVQAFVTSGGANQFANPGFETGAASNTDVNAASWVQFNNAYRTPTNANATALTSHSGAYAMKTYGPFQPYQDASGAYQSFPTSAGQNWRLTGYCLNWQGDALRGPNSYGGQETSYGVGQLLFMDTTGGTGNVLLAVDGPHYGTVAPFPLNQWQSFEVDGTAPTGTVNVRAQVSHVGYAANGGSVYWDDLTVYQPSSSSPTINAVTAQPAVQVAWPTTAPTSNGTINAQIQSIGSILLGIPLQPQTSTNLLLNHSFEPGIEGSPNAASADMFMSTPTVTTNGPWLGWNNWAAPVYSAYYTQRIGAEDGVQCAKTYSGPNGGVYQSVAAAPGESFNASAWFENAGSDAMQGVETADLRLIFHDATNGTGNTLATIVSSTVVSTATTHNVWQQLSVSAIAPSSTVSVTLMGFFNNPNNNGGSMFMDNASLIGTTYGNWQNVGPLYPGNGTTNTLVDLVGTNTAKFYRVITQ
jgi:hypothetical protein